MGVNSLPTPVAPPGAPARGCTDERPHAGPFALRYDQLGYAPDGRGSAVLLGDGTAPPRFRVCDLATGEYLTAPAAPAALPLDARALTGARLRGYRVDLSAAVRAGRYTVVLEGAGALGPVAVATDPHAGVIAALLAFLAAQRCGPTDAARSGHGPCHVFASVTDGDAATASGDGIAVASDFRGAIGEHAGSPVNVEGGWHDAGDYVKFLGTSAFVVVVGLLALRDHPRGLAADRDALVAEMSWGVDWIERMVSPAVPLHQVSGQLDHDVPPRRPEADTATPLRDDDGVAWEHRPAYRIDVAHHRGGNVLGRAVAALALWSAVVPALHPDDPALRALAARRLALARRVYDRAVGLLSPQGSVPPDFYPEDSVRDDLALAAAVLAHATREPAYRRDALAQLDRWMAPGNALAPEPFVYWGDVSAIALAEAARLFEPTSVERGRLRAALAALVAPVAATREHPTGPAAAFGYALPTLGNGSVAQAAGAALACLAAESVDAAAGCREVAAAQIQWVLGRNPFGVCFIAGLGERSPLRVHHDLARVTGVAPRGAVVGGPAALAVRQHSGLAAPGRAPAAQEFARFSTREMFYQDAPEDYVVNEPAIDFAPALLYVLAALAE